MNDVLTKKKWFRFYLNGEVYTQPIMVIHEIVLHRAAPPVSRHQLKQKSTDKDSVQTGFLKLSDSILSTLIQSVRSRVIKGSVNLPQGLHIVTNLSEQHRLDNYE